MIAKMDGQAIGWMWVWPMLVVAGLLIIGYAVLRLARSGRGSSRGGSDSGSVARRILDGRYARGEIDEQEYQHRRRALR
ncbi:SHOCT domain-containing protein [Streptomyces sp. NPDC058964]|uniref:SHOCT domain-containing protein n=1 Tax=Streptomyces sp. NPDC058964 TaxID=3346681 RepID=UPI00368F8814